jgi:hypothetical protein
MSMLGKATDLAAQNENGSNVRLVSLGCYCGPKLTFRKLKCDAETLPFDWIRTRIDGLLHFLTTDFDKFFHYDTRQPSGMMLMQRSYYHSFWHDDLTDPENVEKLKRRIERFQSIDANSDPVLFVRAVCADDEMQHIDKLYQVIQQFGRNAKLLVLVDFQPEDQAVIIEDSKNMLLYKVSGAAHQVDNGGAPYVTPISAGIAWAQSGHVPDARSAPSLSAIHFEPCKVGFLVPSEFDAFESVPKGGMSPLPPNSCFAATPKLRELPFHVSQPEVPASQHEPIAEKLEFHASQYGFAGLKQAEVYDEDHETDDAESEEDANDSVSSESLLEVDDEQRYTTCTLPTFARFW